MGDLYFLNAEARSYIENADAASDYWYPFYCAKIAELFAMVPDSLKNQIQWSGPPIASQIGSCT